MGPEIRRKREVKYVIRILEKHLGVPVQHNGMNPPDPLDMLVATLLSQNTNDANSFRAWKNLKARYPDYESMYRARVSSIEKTIRTGGMAKQKAARIKELLRSVKLRYGSFSLNGLKEKSDADILNELTSVNGVGVKTASCVMLFSLGRKSFPVDTHVHRILNRLGIVRTKNPAKTFFEMQNLVRPDKMYSFHTNLIRFGRETCRAQRPACYRCPLLDICNYAGKITDKDIQTKRTRTKREKRDFMLLDNVGK